MRNHNSYHTTSPAKHSMKSLLVKNPTNDSGKESSSSVQNLWVVIQHVDSIAGEGLDWLSHRGRGVTGISAVDGDVALEVTWGAGRANTGVELGGDGGGGGGLALGSGNGGRGTVASC